MFLLDRSKKHYRSERNTLPLDGFGELSFEWIAEAFFIFEGEMTCCRQCHPGGRPCDKESLVAPLLGMWYDLYERHRAKTLDDVTAELFEVITAQ